MGGTKKKLKLSKASLRRALKAFEFDPTAQSPMQVIMDTRDYRYFAQHARTLIQEFLDFSDHDRLIMAGRLLAMTEIYHGQAKTEEIQQWTGAPDSRRNN